MEQFVVDFVVDYFKTKTTKRKQINNQQLDSLMQESLGTNAFGDGGIRALIHYLRVNIVITNEQGEKGWISASSDGYYLTYNPTDILAHLEQFEGKIRKMRRVHSKGMEILMEKIYYKQTEMQF
jgi:hypothetical protein